MKQDHHFDPWFPIKRIERVVCGLWTQWVAVRVELGRCEAIDHFLIVHC